MSVVDVMLLTSGSGTSDLFIVVVAVDDQRLCADEGQCLLVCQRDE
jgi:hypothetical protein